MEYAIRWDWLTLFLYVGLAFIVSLLLRQSIICKKKHEKILIYKWQIEKKYVYYFIIYLILVFFINTRMVTDTLGGTDTPRYIYLFDTLEYIHFGIKKMIKMSGWEYMYFNFMFLIKSLGLSYSYFSFFIYSIMIYCYLWYFDKNLNDKKHWYISLLLILPYLNSMNIIRNIYAAAIGLFAIQKLNDKKYWSAFAFFVLAYFNHYISALLLLFVVFCAFVPEKWYDSRKKCIIIAISSICITLVSTPILIKLLELTRYGGYVSVIQFSFWGYIPYIVIYILIMLVYDDFIKILKKRNHYIFYKIVVFLSITVPPLTALNGTYRLLLFFEIPRFIMYGDLICILERKIKKYIKSNKHFENIKMKKFDVCFRCFMIVIYTTWIVLRIWRSYDVSHLMPYVSGLFN